MSFRGFKNPDPKLAELRRQRREVAPEAATTLDVDPDEDLPRYEEGSCWNCGLPDLEEVEECPSCKADLT